MKQKCFKILFYSLCIAGRVFVRERWEVVGLSVWGHPTCRWIVVMSADAFRYFSSVVYPQFGWTTPTEEIPTVPELTSICLLIHEPERVILINKQFRIPSGVYKYT